MTAPNAHGEMGGPGNDANNANSCLQCCDSEHNDATEFAVEPFGTRMSFTKEDASRICLSVKMDEWARGSGAADEEVRTLRTNRMVSKYATLAQGNCLELRCEELEFQKEMFGKSVQIVLQVDANSSKIILFR